MSLKLKEVKQLFRYFKYRYETGEWLECPLEEFEKFERMVIEIVAET